MRFDQILKDLRALHMEKAKQYGNAEDPLANIRGAGEFGVPPWTYCLVEVRNCLERLKNVARGRNIEDPRNAFMDGASWFILAQIFWEETQSLITMPNVNIPPKETLGNIWSGQQPGEGRCAHQNVLGGVCQKCGVSIQKPDNPMPSDVE